MVLDAPWSPADPTSWGTTQVGPRESALASSPAKLRGRPIPPTLRATEGPHPPEAERESDEQRGDRSAQIVDAAGDHATARAKEHLRDEAQCAGYASDRRLQALAIMCSSDREPWAPPPDGTQRDSTACRCQPDQPTNPD